MQMSFSATGTSTPVVCINKKAGQLARQFRQGEGSEYEGGVVIVFKNQVGSWMNELRDPQMWEPGCIAVDLEGNQWVAMGGNAYDGAMHWEIAKI